MAKLGWEQDVGRGLARVSLSGTLDVSTAGELRNRLDDLLHAGIDRLLVGLARVEYVGSAGWGIFMHLADTLERRGGALVLYGMPTKLETGYRNLHVPECMFAVATEQEGLILLRAFGGSPPPAAPA